MTLAVLLAACRLVQQSSTAGTTPFVLDGNRTYAEVGFVRPDGVAVPFHLNRTTGLIAVDVEGVLPGDTLLRVGDLETKGASWGAIYAALHGKPGEPRSLVLERDGRRFTVGTKVTGF